MVSKKVLRSVISSGILLNILFSAVDFLLSSWKASSERAERYSTTATSWNICIFLHTSPYAWSTYLLSGAYRHNPMQCPASAGRSHSCPGSVQPFWQSPAPNREWCRDGCSLLSREQFAAFEPQQHSDFQAWTKKINIRSRMLLTIRYLSIYLCFSFI